MNKPQFSLAGWSSIPLLPGILFCLLVVCAARYISEHLGSPLILTTVLLGMAFNNLSSVREFSAGLDYCAKTVLRAGVALLGVRISFDQISSLGYTPILLVIFTVAATLCFSLLLGRLLKMDGLLALVGGVAVAICGVSAAMALLALLPYRRLSDNQVACTLMGVTCISTAAMILYPAFLVSLNLPVEAMGLYLGVTIHDVAQTIGAAELISPAVTELAIYTKMLRVSLLVPVLFIISYSLHKKGITPSNVRSRLPIFLVFFTAIVVVNNLNLIAAPIADSMSSISQLLLLMAMAALGTRTNFLDIFVLDKKPLLLVLLNTLFLALISFVIILLYLY